MISDLFGAILATCGSLACLSGCACFTWRSYKRLRYHRRADATVVRYFCRTDDDKEVAYYPVVRFDTADGQQVLAISADITNHKQWSPGSLVRVSYHPDRPREAVVVSIFQLFIIPFLFALMGTLFAVAALHTWLELV